MDGKPHRFWFHLDKGKWLPYKPGQEPDILRIELPAPPDDFDLETFNRQTLIAIASAISPLSTISWVESPQQPCPDCETVKRRPLDTFL